VTVLLAALAIPAALSAQGPAPPFGMPPPMGAGGMPPMGMMPPMGAGGMPPMGTMPMGPGGMMPPMGGGGMMPAMGPRPMMPPMGPGGLMRTMGPGGHGDEPPPPIGTPSRVGADEAPGPAFNGLQFGNGPPPAAAAKEPLHTLSCEGANAFNDDCYCNHIDGIYVNLGFMALWRTRLGNSVLAVRDPRGNPDLPTLPPPNSPVAININDLAIQPNWGIRATLGYRCDCDAVELTGYYLFQNDSRLIVQDPGRLDLPFAIFPTPFGFAGNNNLWLNADRVIERLRTTIGNLELNYRTSALVGADYIVGVRYLDYREVFSVLTDDDGLTAQPLDPVRVGTYTVDAHTHLIAPQVGIEVERCPWSGIGVGFFGKGAAGVNFVDVLVGLQRADGFGTQQRRSETIFSYLAEAGLFVDALVFDHCRFRFGYQCLWLLNVPQAHAQMEFNIAARPTGSRHDVGDIFYHGPLFEVQIQW
jgi:hypothetical protein